MDRPLTPRAEIEAIASGLARFDHEAIARTEFYIDQVTQRPRTVPRARDSRVDSRRL